MATTIKISNENLTWLKSIHKTPNRALNQLRTGFSDPETELKLLNKKLNDLNAQVSKLENRCFPTF